MKIGIDMDEVLCAINQGMLDRHRDIFGSAHEREDIKEWDLKKLYGFTDEEMRRFLYEFFDSPYHHDAPPVLGALEGIGKLTEHTLFVISARPEHIRDVTEAWLDRHFPGKFVAVHLLGDEKGIGGTKKAKGDLAVELGLDLFIEDSMSNAHGIAEKGVPVLLLDAPWNQGELPYGVRRVKDWKEAVSEVERSASPLHLQSIFGEVQ